MNKRNNEVTYVVNESFKIEVNLRDIALQIIMSKLLDNKKVLCDICNDNKLSRIIVEGD